MFVSSSSISHFSKRRVAESHLIIAISLSRHLTKSLFWTLNVILGILFLLHSPYMMWFLFNLVHLEKSDGPPWIYFSFHLSHLLIFGAGRNQLPSCCNYHLKGQRFLLPWQMPSEWHQGHCRMQKLLCISPPKLTINPSLLSGALGLNPEVLREKEDGVYWQEVLFWYRNEWKVSCAGVNWQCPMYQVLSLGRYFPLLPLFDENEQVYSWYHCLSSSGYPLQGSLLDLAQDWFSVWKLQSALPHLL